MHRPIGFTLFKTISNSQYRAAISVMISNLLICFYSFVLSCPILEEDNFYRNLLYCIVF